MTLGLPGARAVRGVVGFSPLTAPQHRAQEVQELALEGVVGGISWMGIERMPLTLPSMADVSVNQGSQRKAAIKSPLLQLALDVMHRAHCASTRPILAMNSMD